MSRKSKGLTVRVTHLVNGRIDNHVYRCDAVELSELLDRGDGLYGAHLRFVGGDTAWASYARVEYIVAKRGRK